MKVTIGREGTMHGVKVGGSMGLTTWAAFSGGDELAAVDGDFIMTAEEVQPVLEGPPQGGHPHRRPAQPHGRRATRLLLHPLLGQGPGRGAGQGPPARPSTPRLGSQGGLGTSLTRRSASEGVPASRRPAGRGSSRRVSSPPFCRNISFPLLAVTPSAATYIRGRLKSANLSG